MAYEYSQVLKVPKEICSEKTLDAWLSNPERLNPGQKMGYMATDEGDRADLIAYLRKVSPP